MEDADDDSGPRSRPRRRPSHRAVGAVGRLRAAGRTGRGGGAVRRLAPRRRDGRAFRPERDDRAARGGVAAAPHAAVLRLPPHDDRAGALPEGLRRRRGGRLHGARRDRRTPTSSSPRCAASACGRAWRSIPTRRSRRCGPTCGDVDLVLCMTVFPGFGGQSFIADVMAKVAQVRAAVDGGRPRPRHRGGRRDRHHDGAGRRGGRRQRVGGRQRHLRAPATVGGRRRHPGRGPRRAGADAR